MNKFILTSLCFISFSSFLIGQRVEVPSLALTGISFELKGEGFADTLNNGKLIIISDDFLEALNINLTEGSFDTSLTIHKSGNFKVIVEGIAKGETSINIIPGFLSIIPPLLAIALALIFRQVIISLILGIYSGAFFIYGYNPLTAFLRIIDKYIITAVSDVSHTQIIVFTLLFGGVIGLISRSGGTMGIANSLSKLARTRKSGMIATWLSGLIIFFDDYANALVVGNLMRPITDKLKISREKLSFIVDATSAPVASIFIVSSWIGYEVGLIQDGLNAIGSSLNAYSVFLDTIIFRFYPIAMLFFVFLVSITNRDFGSMLKAERRAFKEGKVSSSSSSINKLTETNELFGNEDKAKWYNGVIPILVLVSITVFGLIFTGIGSLKEQGITEYGIRDIISSSNSYLALLWGSFSACVVAAIMIIVQKILSLRETIDAWFAGIRSMLLAILILTLAWSIGAVTNEMRTADYIISLISETIDPRFLPVIVFVVCGLTSFATGTSWGTMAIMFPIVIPLSAAVTGMNHYSPADTHLILIGVVSSVLAGCVWGDHCSPISDTTILSSMASGCDHIDHVRTQLTYAISVSIVTMLIGDILTAFGLSPYIALLLIAAVLLGIIYLFGRKVDIIS
ncbi:MAG: Na+/H+ antiporter NhaC family protein [Ignavibacteriaceae bacterium]|nr:Na+/H+ antiporter NhaC family protein [Ignavibacteriaceae bacterium]